MTLNVTILNRDFTTPPIKPYDFKVDKLTWTAAGGCDQGIISTIASSDRLIEFSSLLRCPVIIADNNWQPCWHGFVDQITIAFDNVRFIVDIDRIFNRVQIRYSFISPDRRFSDVYETSFGSNYASREFYGIREKILYLRNVDDAFVESFHNTFLHTSAWGTIEFFPNKSTPASLSLQQTKISLRCSGWFSTLSWRYYQDLQGLYANHGPGPGSLAFGNGTTSLVAQSFIPGKAVNAKYAWVMLRKVGSPTSNITAKIYSDASGSPSALIATSAAIVGSGLSSVSYLWHKFTFATAVALSSGTRYWLVIDPGTSSATNHYQIRQDENANYPQSTTVAKRYTTAWVLIPNITIPGSFTDLYFRVVTIADTGTILNDIATAGNQFFTNVTSLTTGVAASPYRDNAKTCYDEIIALMNLGTSNQRRILADVTPTRELIFYEQPPSDQIDGYMDRFGRYYTKDMHPLPAYRPPIGKNVMLSSHDRIVLPFDFERAPTYFVDNFTYIPE